MVEYGPSSFGDTGDIVAARRMLSRLVLLDYDKDTFNCWANRVGNHARAIQRAWRSLQGKKSMLPPPARRKASSAKQARARRRHEPAHPRGPARLEQIVEA